MLMLAGTVVGDGAVYTWGGGKYGQLGHGDANDQLVPKRVEALQDSVVTQVVCGAWHTMALS